MNFQLYWD